MLLLLLEMVNMVFKLLLGRGRGRASCSFFLLFALVILFLLFLLFLLLFVQPKGVALRQNKQRKSGDIRCDLSEWI